uniref:Melanopsin-like n=1 Tax=Saccoglossus kowalevskii TaxID=10224 RepID=A0ABM0MYE0_SACKO|nr:PREDICTED: melanopsin-like [Saccoglossus kowalevskii]
MAANSTQQFLSTFVTKSSPGTALDSIATGLLETFIDITAANFTDAFVNITVQNSTETYFDINATNITEEVLDSIGAKPYEQVFDIISTCLIVIVAVVGITGNSLVINILYNNKKLRTPQNIQLLSLAVTDMIVCILTTSMRFVFTVKSLRHGEINIKGPLCTSQIFVFYSSTLITVISLGAISVSRAIGIADKCSPSTKKRVIFSLIFVSWIAGTGYGTWKAWVGEDLSCNVDPVSQQVKNATRSGILIVFLTLCTMAGSYSYIYRVIKRHEKSFQRAMEAGGNSGPRHRKPMDLATLNVFATLISTFMISYLPLACYGMIVVNIESFRNEHVASFFYSVMCLGSMANPILYTLTSDQFKNYLPFKKNTSNNEIQLKQRARTGQKTREITTIYNTHSCRALRFRKTMTTCNSMTLYHKHERHFPCQKILHILSYILQTARVYHPNYLQSFRV